MAKSRATNSTTTGPSDTISGPPHMTTKAFRESLKEFQRDKTARELAVANDRIKLLESELRSYQREELNASHIRNAIIGLNDLTGRAEPPDWVVSPTKVGTLGVPTLFASDWHWGEVVDPNQIGGVNEFDLGIAHERAKRLIERTFHLCFEYLKNPVYPGIVFVLGGDMVSGDIHEDLTATNEREIMPVVLDLYATLIWCIDQLKARFGKVFIPCVTGNHGRNTHKIRTKGRNFTSFDWLVYSFLAKHFEQHPNVQFLIPDGSDAHWRIGNHRFGLTHGDQFRGGDGIIGAIGPVTRGDVRKRARNQEIDMPYDTLLVAHWHFLLQWSRVIINGSLKGYDEWAYANNFWYQPPQQALFLTHPEHGITFSFPTHLSPPMKGKEHLPWVSWK